MFNLGAKLEKLFISTTKKLKRKKALSDGYSNALSVRAQITPLSGSLEEIGLIRLHRAFAPQRQPQR